MHGTPFKVYIYCTLTASKEFNLDDHNWDVSAKNRGGWPGKRGRVIGEFTCKKITGLTHVGETGSWEPASLYVMAPGSYYKPADELLEILTSFRDLVFLEWADQIVFAEIGVVKTMNRLITT